MSNTRFRRSVNAIAVASLFGVACSTGALVVGSDHASVRDPQTPAVPGDRTATEDAGSSAPDDAFAPYCDAATTGDGAYFGDAAPGQRTLYERLGSNPGIKKLMTDTLAAVLRDPQLASYFVFNVPSPAPGHPSASDIVECQTALLAYWSGGPEMTCGYPRTSSGYKCRMVVEAHTGRLTDGGTAVNYRIPNGLFNDYVATLAATATAAGVTPSDLLRLVGSFELTRSDVVDTTRTDGGYFDGG